MLGVAVAVLLLSLPAMVALWYRAVIGSAIPGAGTAIGAGIDALVGLAFGTGVDVALLAAEENLHRATVRAELVEAVDETLASTRDVFGCAAPGSQTTTSAPPPGPGPPP